MERQKREKNAIVIHFAFYLVLTIWILIYLFSSVFGQLKQIEDTKTVTSDLYKNIKRIEKSWLTFEEFTSENTSLTGSVVIKEIVKNISKDFYDKNLINSVYSTHKEFIDKKKETFANTDNQNIIKSNNLIISKILPPYSENSIDFSESALTDYKFINYVESIIETFNFTNNDSIGISNLTLLDGFATSKAQWTSLESNIYYIPLSLDLVWTKEWVIDFLYYIENVGKITLKDNNININNDYWILLKNWFKQALEWEKLVKDYNIFEHQIVDIDKIKFDDYIDSTYVSRWDKKFLDFILDTQWNEQYKVSVNLLFYIKWQPTYKLTEYINKVIDKHGLATWLVTSSLQNKKIDWLERNNLTKNNEILKQLHIEVVSIKKWLSTNEKIEELYKRAIKIDEIIDPIFKSLKK